MLKCVENLDQQLSKEGMLIDTWYIYWTILYLNVYYLYFNFRTGRLNGKNRTKLKRRCSINGHFYNRETSFFTPPYGSQMSVWVTSLVTTPEVINLMLDKYKVDGKAYQFSLFLVFDNGGKYPKSIVKFITW